MAVRYQLPNGLTVVHEEQHAAPVCAFQVWVKVGSADEAPSEVGLAHVHEHMLFKGTARRGLGEIARSIEANGGEINAWTSFDQTAYHVVMASRFARGGLDVLADALRASAFDADELAREIEVVCEEIKRSEDMPSRRASKQLFSQAYRAHPYGRPVIGDEASVRAHTRATVLAFYRKHYVPSNMVLAAVGDFTEQQLRAWVDELFGGDWGGPRLSLVPRPVEPPFAGVRVHLRTDELKEAHLHLAFQGPGAGHPDAPALDVLAMLAGQGDASRLSMEVRRRRMLAKDASAWAWTPRDPGLVAASLVADPERLREAFEETVGVLATLTAVDVAEEELATVKSLIEAEAVFQRETVQGLARKLGYYEAAAGGLEEESKYYEAVSRVSREDVRAVAQRYLTFDRAVVSALLPSGTPLTADDVRGVLERVPANLPVSAPARDLPPPTPIRLEGHRAPKRPGTCLERLPSGATIVVREEHHVPLYALRATFPGGLRYETPTDNGITALLARTWTRGTQTMRAEQVSHLIDQLAGGLGAVPGRSTLGLRGEFLSKHFDRSFELFTEVLARPAFPEGEVAREQQLLLQDLVARDDRPSTVAFELFARALFPAHPYRLSSLGEVASLSSLTSASLRDFHARHLDGSQLTLTVVGDVDTDEVLRRAHAAFGRSRGGAQSPSVVPIDPPLPAPVQVRRQLKKAQAHLVLGFRGARVTEEWRRALEILSTILSGQSGRLFLELRDKRSMAYSVSSTVVEGVDPGYFAVYMGTSPEKVDAALTGIREELERVKADRVSELELARAKESLIGSHDIGLQRNAARAAVMGLDTCYGMGPEHHQFYADEISAVSAEAVRDAAQRVIDFERSALAIVGP